MYDELIKALRNCIDPSVYCEDCGYYEMCYKSEKNFPVIEQAADAIKELQKQLREEKVDNVNLTGWLAEEHAKHLWIPVTERLPEDGTEVLAFNKTGFAYVDCWTDGKWKINSMVDEEHESVTHWMPLPQPPKEET